MGMTTQQSLPAVRTHSSTSWAWVAVALTPVAWAVGLLSGFAGGEGQGEGVAAALVGVLGLLIVVAAPTAAVMLATDAVLAEQPSSRAALVVSVLALLVTLIAIPLLLTSGLGWLIAIGAVVVALAVFAWITYAGRRQV
jgi:hypothetical protein